MDSYNVQFDPQLSCLDRVRSIARCSLTCSLKDGLSSLQRPMGHFFFATLLHSIVYLLALCLLVFVGYLFVLAVWKRVKWSLRRRRREFEASVLLLLFETYTSYCGVLIKPRLEMRSVLFCLVISGTSFRLCMYISVVQHIRFGNLCT